MGHRHSRNRSNDLSMTGRNGYKRLKKRIDCPICGLTFPARVYTYADFDKHMEAHSPSEITSNPIEDLKQTSLDMYAIPDDKRYPEEEKNILLVRDKLNSIKVHWSYAHKDLYINRDTILNDSLIQIFELSPLEMRSEFHINFNGEKCQDAGGLTKEWLGLLIKELFSEELGIFRLGTGKEPKYLPTPRCYRADLFLLTGKILAKAILENIQLDCALCRSVLKKLLGIECNIRDVKYQDLDLYRSLRYMQKNTVQGVFFDTFAVDSYPLVEGGQEIPITDENKEFYFILRVEYETYTSMAESLDSLLQGFDSVIPKEIINGLSTDELNFMICGNPVINFKDWRDNTIYEGEYNMSHKVINWFWEIVYELPSNLKRDLLQFVTGSPRVPIEGFASLKTLRGDRATFKIVPVQYYKGVLPRSHTCFNRLDLPVYPSKALLKSSIENVLANHLLGFGMD
jgi:E3 ubiquitin-protein ligase HUWE1